MDKETKMVLLNRLLKIKSQRKSMESMFRILTEKKDDIDMRLIDKILDAENELKKEQEIIESHLNM